MNILTDIKSRVLSKPRMGKYIITKAIDWYQNMTTKHQQAQMDTDNGFPLCKNTMVEIYEDMHK